MYYQNNNLLLKNVLIIKLCEVFKYATRKTFCSLINCSIDRNIE